MKLSRAICTNCGYGLEVDLDSKVGVCPACQSKFVIENAVHLNTVEVDKTKELLNLRRLLRESVKVFDDLMIQKIATDILSIIPDDFSAAYYRAFALQRLGKPKYIKAFYEHFDIKTTDDELSSILEHILHHSDLRDKEMVFNFINHFDQDRSNEFLRLFKERALKEDDYALIPRDVFICHRSTDQPIADKIITILERDGMLCWISSRNLRPNDMDNYWTNIEEALRACKIFVVISSQDAMLSKDVQFEMELAIKYNKPKIEYKIDDSSHTSYFKHVFEGVKWVDGYTNQDSGYAIIKTRVNELLRSIKKNDHPPMGHVVNEFHPIKYKAKDRTEKIYKIIYVAFSIILALGTYLAIILSWRDYSVIPVSVNIIGLLIILWIFENYSDKIYKKRFGIRRKKILWIMPPWLWFIPTVVLAYKLEQLEMQIIINVFQAYLCIVILYINRRILKSEPFIPIKHAPYYLLLLTPAIINMLLGIYYILAFQIL